MSQVPSLMDDPSYEKIREKHRNRQEKQAAKHIEHKEAIASGEKKLIVDRLPTGLYAVRWEGGGVLPECLKGTFTRIDRIKAIAYAKYGTDILR